MQPVGGDLDISGVVIVGKLSLRLELSRPSVPKREYGSTPCLRTGDRKLDRQPVFFALLKLLEYRGLGADSPCQTCAGSYGAILNGRL